MNLLHETVSHKRFGRGVVSAFDGHVVTVSFDTAGERAFSYPTAFASFLTAEDPAVQAEAEAALREKKSESASVVSRVEQDIAELRSAARKKPAVRRAPRKAGVPSKAQV